MQTAQNALYSFQIYVTPACLSRRYQYTRAVFNPKICFRDEATKSTEYVSINTISLIRYRFTEPDSETNFQFCVQLHMTTSRAWA